jgi:hypothetical protein
VPWTPTQAHIHDAKSTKGRRTEQGLGGHLQFDATTDGRPIKIVSIVDEHTREFLCGLVERSITTDGLLDELDRLAATGSHTAILRCDNGPALACDTMADWAGKGIELSEAGSVLGVRPVSSVPPEMSP